jgi:hypothetical protein
MVVFASPVLAADSLVTGRRIIVAPAQGAFFDSKDTITLPTPAGAADPTLVGASVRFYDTGNPGNQAIYSLPAVNWQGLGNPPGDKGYRYRGNGGPADPCDADLQEDEIDVNCNNPASTPTIPFSGEGGFVLTLGANVDRYCAVLGGTLANNSAELFKRVNAPAPPTCTVTAAPFDTELPGNRVTVRPGRVARFVTRSTTPLPLPDAGGDAPIVEGASLRLFDTGGDAGDVTYPLPSTGGSYGALGYKYRGTGSDPCRVVQVTPTVVKAICRGAGVTLTPPFNGEAAMVLTVGDGTRYCSQYGGIEIRNDDVVLRRKTAPAPGACASPSGAFLEIGADVLE